jgi:hypothetical protein
LANTDCEIIPSREKSTLPSLNPLKLKADWIVMVEEVILPMGAVTKQRTSQIRFRHFLMTPLSSPVL